MSVRFCRRTTNEEEEHTISSSVECTDFKNYLTMCKQNSFNSPPNSLQDHDAGSSSDCSLNNKNGDASPSSFAQVDPLIQASNQDELQPAQQLFNLSIPRFSLAKLSIFFLAFATIFDMALTKMSSSDVERGPRASLGSAAISSLTDTLSPILPFAGGLDLRRDDYWSVAADGNWFGTLQSVVSQVQDAFARKQDETAAHSIISTPRGSGASSRTQSKLLSRTTTASKGTQTHEMSITAQQPFVSLDTIAQLTLGDIGECFRYAIRSSDADFNESQFLSGMPPELKKVIQGMQEAVDRSRGDESADWVRITSANEATIAVDSVDALKFSAAMRVFAEWRLLRQVPAGYKGFAVGMSLGHKDVVQNIIKMEEAVHGWLDHQRDLCDDDDDSNSCSGSFRTPTLRELLSYEVETGVHPASRLPHLKEKSAGMGLLWVRRQLAYQTQIFDNVLDLDNFSSMKDAVGAAYTQVYNQYHGWAVQKIFNYSFQSAPEAEEILRHMNPHRLRELLNEQRRTQGGNDMSSSSADASSSSARKDENPVEQFVNHIGREWDKLAFHVVKVFNKKAEQPPTMQVRGGAAVDDQTMEAVSDDYITQEMVKDAHTQIAAYLRVAKPLLDSLATLFDDLNMDDPMRV